MEFAHWVLRVPPTVHRQAGGRKQGVAVNEHLLSVNLPCINNGYKNEKHFHLEIRTNSCPKYDFVEGADLHQKKLNFFENKQVSYKQHLYCRAKQTILVQLFQVWICIQLTAQSILINSELGWK